MAKLKMGTVIAERRKHLGLSQSDLARKLCVSNKAISKWERGHGYPDVTILVDLACALDIPIAELMRTESAEPGVVPPSYASALIKLERPGTAVAYPSVMTTFPPTPQLSFRFFTIAALVIMTLSVVLDLLFTNLITWSPLMLVAVATAWLTARLFLFTNWRLRSKLSLPLVFLGGSVWLTSLQPYSLIPAVNGQSLVVALIFIALGGLVWCGASLNQWLSTHLPRRFQRVDPSGVPVGAGGLH